MEDLRKIGPTPAPTHVSSNLFSEKRGDIHLPKLCIVWLRPGTISTKTFGPALNGDLVTSHHAALGDAESVDFFFGSTLHKHDNDEENEQNYKNPIFKTEKTYQEGRRSDRRANSSNFRFLWMKQKISPRRGKRSAFHCFIESRLSTLENWVWGGRRQERKSVGQLEQKKSSLFFSLVFALW